MISWQQLEVASKALPLTNKPLNDIGDLDMPLHTEYLLARDYTEAELVVKYALKYGAEDVEIMQSADGSECSVAVHMLPMEIMRMHGYLDGLAEQK